MSLNLVLKLTVTVTVSAKISSWSQLAKHYKADFWFFDVLDCVKFTPAHKTVNALLPSLSSGVSENTA